jgi:carotenoid cleavage dioxygenase-like enzyme
MSVTVSRRDALQYMGLGALALGHSSLFMGCGDERRPLASARPAYELDPDRPWWVQPPFEPVTQENEAFGLTVVGEIPRELDGLFVRNGINSKHGDRGHFFAGDGMLHGVRLQDGQAHWYRNRYVQTPALNRDQSERVNPVLNPADNYSNISVFHHSGKLLSLGETGLPFEISAEDLSTIGAYDFGGKLKTFMTAHPKLDPRTGELHMFGYGVAEPYLTYHLVDAAGALLRSEPIVLPHSVMIHDFLITESSVVFWDLPVGFDPAAAVRGEPIPFRWRSEYGARIGIMPRAGGNADVIWVEIEPCFVFHGWNAYDDDAGRVVLEVSEYPHLWLESTARIDADPRLVRYTVDTRTKSAKREPLDDRPADLPRIDPRRIGVKHRYGYAMWANTLDFSQPVREIGYIKYDRERDTATLRQFDFGFVPGEPFFIPKSENAAEDDGYLLSYVYELGAKGSSLDIFDAREIEAPALASIRLPWRVPVGLHSAWISG